MIGALDMLHTPADGNCEVQFFKTPGMWATWDRPAGTTMAMILLFSGGGGGGGGRSGGAGNRGGGGGGGCSGTTRLIVPTLFLPSRIYVFAGAGGAGGTANNGGIDGALSHVSLAPDSSIVDNIIAVSGAAAPIGGNTGTTLAGGTGGGAGTIAVNTAMPVGQSIGYFLGIAGRAGGAGGAHTGANGTNVTFTTTGTLCLAGPGGAGGSFGGTSFAGGTITAISGAYLSEQAPVVPATGTNDGSGGYTVQPLYAMCGCGGSSNGGGNGGNGGNGAWPGGGGAGGGAGTTGGMGGDGGHGGAIIIAW